MASVLQINNDNFASEVKSASMPVLVDFGADWCGPCKKLAPVVESMAKQFAGKLKVGYVDVGVSQQIAMEYRVMSVPTLLFFKQGQVVKQIVGARSADELQHEIEEVLA